MTRQQRRNEKFTHAKRIAVAARKYAELQADRPEMMSRKDRRRIAFRRAKRELSGKIEVAN